MKKLAYLLLSLALVVAGCGSKQLSKDDAMALIRKEFKYPHVYDHDIFCGDPEHARKVLDKGLEEKGLVIIHRTLKIREMAYTPIIEFTSKAKPYLMTTPPEDREHKIQKVKVGDEDIVEIKSIASNGSDKTAVVEYTTSFKNRTPFAVLVPIASKPEIPHTVTFILSDEDGWILQK